MKNLNPIFIVTSGIGLLGKAYECKSKEELIFYLITNFSQEEVPFRLTIKTKNTIDFICSIHNNILSIKLQSVGNEITLEKKPIDEAVNTMINYASSLNFQNETEKSEFIQRIRNNREAQASKLSIETPPRFTPNSNLITPLIYFGALGLLFAISKIINNTDPQFARRFLLCGILIWFFGPLIFIIVKNGIKKTTQNIITLLYSLLSISAVIFVIALISSIFPSSCTDGSNFSTNDVYYRK